MKLSKLVPSVGVLSLLLAAPAQAQVGPGDAADDSDEIVVTGTQIRGVQATGSQSVTLNEEAIIQQGANSTNELLQTIPQLGGANARFEGDPRGATNGITINRPNLRNLPGFNSASGSGTLILMDGHHLAPVGVNESAIDPDVIPAAVLERLEVVTDGGSSVYGADAVGGVINFITKREFDGLQVDANYGVGDTIDGFSQWDATITGGTSWARGNGYISVGHSDREGITNGETSWSQLGIWGTDDSFTPIGTQCRTPVGTEKHWFWVDFLGIWTDNPLAPGTGVFPLGSPCDPFAEQSYLPEQQRDNLFASLTQDLTDNINLHVTGYYTKRTTTFANYPRGYTTAANDDPPAPLPSGTPTGTIGIVPLGVGFTFDPNAGYVSADEYIEFETWGITPEVTVDLSHGWQVRNMLFYGGSNNTQVLPGVNTTLAQALVDSGDLDPFDVASANPADIAAILDWESAFETNQEIADFRSVADGPIMQLPGGALRGAFGFEYIRTDAEVRQNAGAVGSVGGVSFQKDDRDVWSAFGELSIPVSDALDLSVSARYDNYSDFGSTTNPNLGFDLHPISWFSIFGHWGKSFNAPTVLDHFGVGVGQLNLDNGESLTAYDVFNQWIDHSADDVFQLTGSAGALGPQTSEQWELGFDANPINGLRFNLTYYEIDFSNILGAVNPLDPRALRSHPEKAIWNPTQADFDRWLDPASPDYLANADEIMAQLTAQGLSPSDFAFILDRRTSNVDAAKLQGFDFGISYTRDTEVGTFEVGLQGNHQTRFTINDVDYLAFNTPDIRMQGNLGWSLDNLSTVLTINYSGGFDTDTGVTQTSVDSFMTTDLFVGYNFADLGSPGTSVRFLVDNITDEEPPQWHQAGSQNVSYSGYTLGRVFKIGFTQNF